MAKLVFGQERGRRNGTGRNKDLEVLTLRGNDSTISDLLNANRYYVYTGFGCATGDQTGISSSSCKKYFFGVFGPFLNCLSECAF